MDKDRIVIPPEIWQQVEITSKECQIVWGMGFPVISITLLKKILKRQAVGRPKRSIGSE